MAGSWITDSQNNRIHATALVDTAVELGSNNYIGPYCIFEGKVYVGDGNVFTAHCSIGTPAEHRTNHRPGHVKILNNNIFREFITVNASTDQYGTLGTLILDNCYLMTKSHVGHDVWLEEGVTLCTGALIGGHSYVMKGATVGLGATVHQRTVIGAHSILGMNSVVPRRERVEPGMKYAGNPIRPLGINHLGLERGKVSDDELRYLRDRYENIFKKT